MFSIAAPFLEASTLSLYPLSFPNLQAKVRVTHSTVLLLDEGWYRNIGECCHFVLLNYGGDVSKVYSLCKANILKDGIWRTRDGTHLHDAHLVISH